MRLDMERICQLAGVKNKSRSKSGYGVLSENTRSNRKSLLREGFDPDEHNEGTYHEGEGHDEGTYYEGEGHDEMVSMEEEDVDKNEIVEVDEAMLVQELRRARRLMNESRKRKARKKQKLQEMQLKGIIDQEVKNVLKELQLNSSWVYGKNKPTRSRKGYVHQGSFLKGIGFK